MTLYKICHQSGRVLFTTDNEVTARNREQFGWKVIEVDKSREQFEKYMKAETNHPLWRTEYPMTKDQDQQYSDHTTNMAWFAWQASRAAIEIDVTPPSGYIVGINDVPTDHFEAGRQNVINSIHVAGITVKSANDIANDTGTE